MDPISAIFNLVSNVGGWINDSVKQKREIAAAAAENTVRLLRDEQSNNAAWEMASLQDKDKGLRWVSAVIFFFPLIWAGFDPDGARIYFETIMNVLPEWYRQIVFAIVGGIWGVSALKNVVPSMVGQTIAAITKKDAPQ